MVALLVLSTTVLRAQESELLTAEEEAELAGDELVLDESAGPAVDRGSLPGTDEYWRALSLFRKGDEAALSEGREALLASASLELPHAQHFLGQCYESGWFGFRENKRKAAAQYRLAAERGSGYAQTAYGVCLLAGIGERKDLAAAEMWLRRAAAAEASYAEPAPPAEFQAELAASPEAGAVDGVAGAMAVDRESASRAVADYFLAVVLMANDKAAEAHPHFVKAALAGPGGRSGLQQAATSAALGYAFGQGVERDIDKANEMLELSKKLDRRSSVTAIHDLVTKSAVDAFAVVDLEEELARVADERTVNLQYEIAEQLLDRDSDDYAPREAVKWLELAAESGKAWAMLRLGFLYSGDELGAPDRAEAFKWWERAGSGEPPKHTLGVANLVISLVNGLGVEPDPERALALARRHQSDDLVSYLATIDACPTQIITYEERVELVKLWATERDDSMARYILGDAYEHGYGVDRDVDDAIKWYRRAAKQGNAEAMYALGRLYDLAPGEFRVSQEKGNKEALELYQAAADLGHRPALIALGNFYRLGVGVKKDFDRAIRAYRRAIELDPETGSAYHLLGTVYRARYVSARNEDDLVTARENRQLAIDAYEQALDHGYDAAAGDLGRIYHDDFDGQQDLMLAYGYLEQGADAGHLDARLMLAGMLDKGEGVPVSLDEAAYHYRILALEGDWRSLGALTWLVAYYTDGRSGPPDVTRATFWLERLVMMGYWTALPPLVDASLAQGNYADAVELLKMMRRSDSDEQKAYAYERLSTCYLKGWGLKQSTRRSRAYLKKATALGNADAQVRTANILIKDGKPHEGIKLFEKAAEDSGAACFALGQMHYFGQYLPKDLEKAVEYFRQAAEWRHRDAMFFLAGMAATGAAGAPDLDDALDYARGAESLGHPQAAKVRSMLEKRRLEENSETKQTSGPRSI